MRIFDTGIQQQLRLTAAKAPVSREGRREWRSYLLSKHERAEKGPG
jgi:hypothetical protein